MFRLPAYHPQIRNCVNTMAMDDIVNLNIDNWEVDSDGYVAAVAVEIDMEKDDSVFIHDLSIKANIPERQIETMIIPLRVQLWLNDNTTGLWFYQVDTKPKERIDIWAGVIRQLRNRRLYKFHFEKFEDATLFKLTWS